MGSRRLLKPCPKWGEVRGGPAPFPLELREEQPRLAGGGLRRVRAVHHVAADLSGEIAADRAGGGLQRIGRADRLPRGPDRVRALEHHREDRARGYEVDELTEERALCALGVVALRQLAIDRRVTQRDDPQALALEAGDYLAAQPAGEGVGLDQYQGAIHGCFEFLWVVSWLQISSSFGEARARQEVGRGRRARPVRGATTGRLRSSPRSSSALAGARRSGRSSASMVSLSTGGVRRRRVRGWMAPGTSVSQYGQIVHAWSSGREQLMQRSLSLRRQLGQRMKSR